TESAQFNLIDENAKWLSKRKDDNIYSLNISKFKKQQEGIELESKKFKAISQFKDNLVFNSLPYENTLIEKDSVLKEKRVRWHESLSKDAYVEEALNILGDLQPKSLVKSQMPVKGKKGKLVGSL
ncbi:MAG: carboxy terminal-processing peptidase, partial [Flavobacterium sp.]|nr:carboxy terminal-processing peptidase [Flavobacterium sp.]